MDPPTTLMNETTSFNLSEIWPTIPLNGGDDHPRGSFGSGLARFSEPDLVCEGPGAMSDSDSKRLKSSGSGDESSQQQQHQKADNNAEVSSGKQKSNATPPPDTAHQKDYIHVRARRGQATDSHSLAERARREKISERMRILQDLVPGCNKVIGKALVLDEIINYIQSLQRQVEFLSMKLEAVNARVGPAIEGFPAKDFGQEPYDAGGAGYCSQTPREYGRDASPDWLHMQIGGGFERET